MTDISEKHFHDVFQDVHKLSRGLMILGVDTTCLVELQLIIYAMRNHIDKLEKCKSNLVVPEFNYDDLPLTPEGAFIPERDGD